MLNEEHQLISLIYDAALDNKLWPQVLEKLVKVSNGNSAVLTSLDNLNPKLNFAYTHNITPDTIEAYTKAGMDAVDKQVHVKFRFANRLLIMRR